MNSEQEIEELNTFQRFVDVCPVAISRGSITNRNPPEPDIACEFTAAQEAPETRAVLGAGGAGADD